MPIAAQQGNVVCKSCTSTYLTVFLHSTCSCIVVACNFHLHYGLLLQFTLTPLCPYACTVVDIQQLSCEDSSMATVCGSDGQTYSSACDLYRERFGRVHLRHQGDCASADCPNEMVGRTSALRQILQAFIDHVHV